LSSLPSFPEFISVFSIYLIRRWILMNHSSDLNRMKLTGMVLNFWNLNWIGSLWLDYLTGYFR
jgi:hypothetical protein